MEPCWGHQVSVKEQHKSCSSAQLLPAPWVGKEETRPALLKWNGLLADWYKHCLSVAQPLGSPFLIQQGFILTVNKILSRAAPRYNETHQHLCICNQQRVSKQSRAWTLPEAFAFWFCVCRAGNPGPLQCYCYHKCPKQKLKGGELQNFFRRWWAMRQFVHLCQTQPKKAAGGRWFEYRKTNQNGSKPQKYQFSISWTIT